MTWALLLLGVLSFVVIAVKSYQSIKELMERHHASHHAMQSRVLIEETFSLLKDLEIGQRGFVITGDEAFLEPFYQSHEKLHTLYSTMKASMQEEGKSFPYEKLDRLVRLRAGHAAYVVELRRHFGESMIQNKALFLEGKSIMDEIRQELSNLTNAQNAIVESRTNEINGMAGEIIQRNRWLFVCGTVVLILAASSLILEKKKRDRAEEALQKLNASLEMTVAERTSELNSALRRITAFTVQLDANVEAERRRLAREVHDQLGQLFTALSFILVENKVGKADEESKVWHAQVTSLLSEGVAVSRRICHELRPPLLDDFGLEAAINHYMENLTQQGGIGYAVDVEKDKALTAVQANQLFRIAQEAVTNVLRHAQARQIFIQGIQDRDGYHFLITDDGRGPGPIRADASGVRNMRERAMLASGSFSIQPAEGGGTTVSVFIPKKVEASI
jgi:signal transduction histidine kinase